MCIHIVCGWGGAFVGFLVDLAPIREALHAIEITGQLPSSDWSLDLSQPPSGALEMGNHFDRILFFPLV